MALALTEPSWSRCVASPQPLRWVVWSRDPGAKLGRSGGGGELRSGAGRARVIWIPFLPYTPPPPVQFLLSVFAGLHLSPCGSSDSPGWEGAAFPSHPGTAYSLTFSHSSRLHV